MSNDFDFDFSIDDILTEFTESTAASQPDTEQSSEEREVEAVSAPDATTNMSIYGDVLVTTTSKRPVSYDMVSIQLKLVPQTEYWETLTTDAIQLTYEGEGSWKKDIQSSTAETVEEPTYEVVVVSVKGTAIAK